MLLDLETLSEWDFQGKATKGELAGRQLARVEFLQDYWFDWVKYNPTTEVVRPGSRSGNRRSRRFLRLSPRNRQSAIVNRNRNS